VRCADTTLVPGQNPRKPELNSLHGNVVRIAEGFQERLSPAALFFEGDYVPSASERQAHSERYADQSIDNLVISSDLPAKQALVIRGKVETMLASVKEETMTQALMLHLLRAYNGARGDITDPRVRQHTHLIVNRCLDDSGSFDPLKFEIYNRALDNFQKAVPGGFELGYIPYPADEPMVEVPTFKIATQPALTHFDQQFGEISQRREDDLVDNVRETTAEGQCSMVLRGADHVDTSSENYHGLIEKLESNGIGVVVVDPDSSLL
jgi:hypothetical protein